MGGKEKAKGIVMEVDIHQFGKESFKEIRLFVNDFDFFEVDVMSSYFHVRCKRRVV